MNIWKVRYPTTQYYSASNSQQDACEKKEQELEEKQKQREERQKEREAAAERGEEVEPEEISEDEPESDEPFVGLNKKEQEEKEKLITRGFGNWTKKDFTAFTKACEYYGRNEYDDIARDVGTKTPQEVKQYSKVFWKKIKDLAGM